MLTQYWERKKLENARHGRRLGEPLSMGEWILRVRRINIVYIRAFRYLFLGEGSHSGFGPGATPLTV